MTTSLTLNNGNKMPALGLGTWKSEPGKVTKAVEHALLKANYKHIDCAAIYGNEKEIGAAFTSVFESGKVKREDVFVTSKLWNTEHHPDNVEKACQQTLKDLNLEYLDLYLIHWGIAFEPSAERYAFDENGIIKTIPVSIKETWQAMEKLVEKGLVKSIGVSNFTTPMLVDLLTYAEIKPAVNQIELHAYHNQQALVDFCGHKEIAVTAYCPLGKPGNLRDGEPVLLQSNELAKIAENHDKTPAQVLLRWAVQRGTIAIPKSVTPARIEENINIFDFELTEKEMAQINVMDKGYRFVNPSEGWGLPYFD
jgi:diketogulonate reductase-like aldo/keto reductase